MWVTPYLGQPGNMIALPPPEAGSAPSSRGDSAQTLLSGGTAVVGRLHSKREYTLNYPMLLPSEADILAGFYSRTYGLGPWVYVDPTAQNVLGLDVASCGIRSQAAHGWLTVDSVGSPTGTLTRTTGGPSGIPTTGVLSWTGFAASHQLYPVVNQGFTPVRLPAEAATASLWIKASSATTVNFAIAGLAWPYPNSFTGDVVTTSVAVGTTWAQISITAAAGTSALANSPLVTPRISLPTTGLPTSIQIAAAQLEYNPTVSPWRRGQGSPRVLIKQSLGYDTPALGYSSQTLVLGEV